MRQHFAFKSKQKFCVENIFFSFTFIFCFTLCVFMVGNIEGCVKETCKVVVVSNIHNKIK